MLVASPEFINAMNSPLPKETYIKLEFYDRHMNFINEITKFVTVDDLANISVDRERAIRRSFSFALDNSSDENLFSWGEDELIWLDKRVKVHTGIKLADGTIEYVCQGVFVCTDLYEQNNFEGKKTYVSGQDKALLLSSPMGQTKGIYKVLVGEDLMVYPPGESPGEVKSILQQNSSIDFIDRLLNPSNYPNPTISRLDLFSAGEEYPPTADPELLDFFSNQFITHALELRPSPEGTDGEDPYRVFSKVWLDGSTYKIIHDVEEAHTAANARGDFLDFPTYYEATVFMIHAFTREYFEYYQGKGIDIGGPSAHLRPPTTDKLTDIIKWILVDAGEVEQLLMDDFPQYEGDPEFILMGTDILTRDLEYSEGTPYIEIIEELCELLGAEFFYNTEGVPVLRKIELNHFQSSPVVMEYGDAPHNSYLYAGNERRLNISNLANRIHVYGGGSETRTIIYRLVVDETDPLFANSPYSIQRIGEFHYAHNGGEPDPVIDTVEKAIDRALFVLRDKMGYSEEVPIQIMPNYLLDAGDIISIQDARAGVSAKYMIDKFDIPLVPAPMTLQCRREIRAIGQEQDDWDAIRAELIRRYKEEERTP